MEEESRIQLIKGVMLKHPDGGWYRMEFEVSSQFSTNEGHVE